MAATSILVIGDCDSETMRPVRRLIDSLIESGAIARFAADLDASIKRGRDDNWFADLVVVCQHWSDEFSEHKVWKLLSRHPLARLTCCYGPWCESDGRTRDIWPLAVRVPVRATEERIRRELDVIAGRCAPLPLTASRDEIFLFDAESSITDRLAMPT